MQTKSIKCKLILKKDNKDREIIQNGYELLNRNVKKIEEFFILIRGKDYYYYDENCERKYKTQKEVEDELDEYLKKFPQITDTKQCKEVLGELNKIIMEKGSQLAGSLTKLYNSESTAGTNVMNKIVEPEPEFVAHFNLKSKSFDDEKYKKMADEWIESEEGKNALKYLLDGSGRPSAFKMAYQSKKEWYEAFIKDQIKFKKEVSDGLAYILFRLERLNALPILKLPEQLVKEYPTWIKLYLKCALENVASYIQSDLTTRENYSIVEKRYEEMKEIVHEKYETENSAIEAFLKENYSSQQHESALNQRMCRGLSQIRMEWKKCSSQHERERVLHEYQADRKKQKSIGDINFFNWLADNENYVIIEKKDCLETILDCHLLRTKLENMQKCASFTTADYIKSKRYLFYEQAKGSNFKKYVLEYDEKDRLYVSIPVLNNTCDNNYIEKMIKVQLADNEQFQGPYNKDTMQKLKQVKFTEGKKEIGVEYSNGKVLVPLQEGESEAEYENFTGKLGGADILVDVSNSGVIKNAYFAMTITLNEKCLKEFQNISNNAMYHYATAYTGKATKKEESLYGQKVRALSVDLGIKQFAAAAVYEHLFEEGKDNLQASCERKFLLKMDGEKVSNKVEKYRDEALKELRELKREINYIAGLRRLYNMEDLHVRKERIQISKQYTKNEDKDIFYSQCMTCDDINEMNRLLEEEFRININAMNNKMKEFRAGKMTKKQKRNYEPGKSYWSIAYLEELRKLLMAWNAQGYHIDAKNKTEDKEYGVTATRLLKHINNLKDDRIKAGSDLIVQAARGYIYNEELHQWEQKYAPCNVIIFEDLSRYRFTSDRPKSENSKLMKWSHREIISETKRQAAIYGIEVYDSTDAVYTSKFYFKNDAPGIRADRLSKNDFYDGKVKDNVFKNLPDEMKKYSDKLVVGSIVPSEIGSIFVTLDENKNLIMMNADMNAACNLQKRFWSRHTHLIKLDTTNVDGRLELKQRNKTSEMDTADILELEDNIQNQQENMGKRMAGKYLYHFGNAKVILQTDEHNSNHFRCVEKEKGMKSPMVGSEKRYSLMRDPSGIFFGDSDCWIGYQEFWQEVNKQIIKKLIEAI